MEATAKLLRTRDVAERLGVHPATVRAHGTELGAVKIGARATRYPEDRVAAFIAKRTVVAAS